jgi:hypothetical protein
MDAKQYAPATQRNREPILEILAKAVAPKSTILEIASGTGEHALFFASRLQSCRWIPSDISPLSRESILAWKNTSQIDNLNLDSPLSIDVTKAGWQQQVIKQNINVIVNINMIHISPWSACLGLMEGAGEILPSGGILYLYGPYKSNGEHTALSNASFDRSLRDRNSQWGIRDLAAVVKVAAKNNLRLQEVFEMPANNLSVIFSR